MTRDGCFNSSTSSCGKAQNLNSHQEIHQVVIMRTQSIPLIENHLSRNNETTIQHETENRVIL